MYTTGEGSPATQGVPGRRFDLGDLGTEIDEQLGAVGTGDVAGDFDDAQPAKAPVMPVIPIVQTGRPNRSSPSSVEQHMVYTCPTGAVNGNTK